MSRKHRTTIDHLLGSCVRARLIVVLIKEPGRRPWLRELCREAGPGVSFVRRELAQLEDMGLVTSRRDSTGLRFSVAVCHPLYTPLRDLVRACERVDTGLEHVVPQNFVGWRAPNTPTDTRDDGW